MYAWCAARFAARVIVMRSMVFEVARAVAYRTPFSFIHANHHSRCATVNCFESFIFSFSLLFFSFADSASAHTTTGPASGPRPTSSMPIVIFDAPFIHLKISYVAGFWRCGTIGVGMPQKFVHLHTHSHYSLLDGLATPAALAEQAKKLGMDALALTDHGNLYGAVDFYKAAKNHGIKPILGVEAYIAQRTRHDKAHGADDKSYHLTLLCENLTGWKNLMKLTTKANLEGFYYKPRMDKELLRAHHEGLIALSGCYSSELIRTILHKSMADAEAVIRAYQDIFGVNNYFIEITHHPNFSPKDYAKARPALISLAQKFGIPLVATQDIHYLKKEDAEYHDILLAVGTGNKVSDQGRLSLKADDFSMRSPEEMAACFHDVPEALSTTVLIAERCAVELSLGKNVLPHFPLPPHETANSYLKKLISERMPVRYPQAKEAIRERVEYELNVIEHTGFAAYFLIVQDFINWAKDRGIKTNCRGSAVGSAVSFVLGITDIDPLLYDLLFERFLNPDRIQMPDIDVDIADARRGEVLGYLRERYGDDRVANIITFGTMAARAAVRDVGRVLGAEYALCDRISKLIPFNQDLKTALEGVHELRSFIASLPMAQKIIDAALHLEGVARHVSVHACGTVITEGPLTDYVPLQYAPQDPSTIITQFEMYTVEALGLLKMDLLGLKNLTILEEAVRLVRESGAVAPDLDRLSPTDQKTYAMLREGDTTGVFQFESAGMRRYMKILKPTSLDDLVALVSLYRPGPMELIPSYIKRKHGEEPITYLHPKLEPILKSTYGIGIYQEQMMRIARDLAGFTLAEADTLRQAIGKKIKSLLHEQQEKIISGMVKNGIDLKIAQVIWDLFPPFARYGFNKSHAVSYAIIGYQTAYLRAHYPVEYMTALLNADAGDVERIAFLVSECQKMTIIVLPPDINKSAVQFAPEGKNIRFGLLAIKNVGQNIVDAIVAERGEHGPFASIAQLLYRVNHKDLNKKSLESLMKAGALDSLGVDRATLIANSDDILKFAGLARRSKNEIQAGLFGNGGVSENALKLKPAPPLPLLEKLRWEKELLGLYISDHPLSSFKEKFAVIKARPISDALKNKNENEELIVGGLISKIQRIVTKTGKPMAFVTIEDFTHSIEVIVFPTTLEKTGAVWQVGAVAGIIGRMSWRDHEPRFIADHARGL